MLAILLCADEIKHVTSAFVRLPSDWGHCVGLLSACICLHLALDQSTEAIALRKSAVEWNTETGHSNHSSMVVVWRKTVKSHPKLGKAAVAAQSPVELQKVEPSMMTLVTDYAV